MYFSKSPSSIRALRPFKSLADTLFVALTSTAILSLIKLANEVKAQRMNLEEVKNIFQNKVY